MSNVADSWNHSAVPLSIFTNGTASHLSLRRDVSLPEGVEEESKLSSSNASCSALKERDYIGLWDSSSPCVQGVKGPAAISSTKCGAKASDLQAKDTELRLGLGPSLNNGVQVDVAQNGLQVEAKSDVSVVLTHVSKICVSEQVPLPEQQHVATPQSISRKNDSEQYLPVHDGNGRGSSVPDIAPPSAARAYVPQGFFPNLNGEQHLPSQRGSLPPQGKGYYSSADGFSNDLSMQEDPHNLVNGQVLNAKPLIGSPEFRFASHDVVSSTETGAPYDASTVQKFWQVQMSRPIEGYRSLPGHNANVTDGALAPGRFAVPVPKVSTVPAKRPFDTIAEHNGASFVNDSKNDPRGNAAAAGVTTPGGVTSGSLGRPSTEGEVKYGASQAPKVHTASGFFPWTNVIQRPGGWQPMPAHFKAPTPANVAAHGPENEAKTSAKHGNDVNNEDGGSRAAVVGWPPIRSFRKNTLAAHAKPNDDNADVVGEPSTTHYVKAKLDGAKVQRKVDLNFCNSHENLKLALQDLFEGFINGHSGGPNTGENEKLDLVQGSDYVIAYEDFEGDLMLARDVPWDDFVTKVKRLRVMKASEAKVGSAKLGTHVNG